MDRYQLIIAAVILALVAFQLGTRRVAALAKNTTPTGFSNKTMRSIPRYYGYCTAIWSIVPAAALLVLISIFDSSLISITSINSNPYIILFTVLATALMGIAIWFINPDFNARDHFERWLRRLFVLCMLISVSITAFIFVSVLFESIKFFEQINVFDFLFGLEWSPQTALRSDQAGSSGSFGIIPVFLGTALITLVAMCVAIPLGLMSAIYLAEYAKPRARNIIKPVLEVLAGIPTVVYGYFAALTMGPLLRDVLAAGGIHASSESALAAGLVMGIMIIPFVMSLSDDVMSAVPRSLRDGSLALGATRSETIKKVTIPAALPGIMGACLLAISRAIGETMIVVMAAGLIATLTINPLDSVTTVTAQIVKLLVGDQEFDSAKTLAAFALSLVLFIITLALNFAALLIVKKYRERYE